MRGHLGHTAKFACRQVASFRTSAFRGRGQPTRADRDLPLLARSRRIDSQAGHAGDTRTAHVVTVGLVPVEQLTLVPQREQASVTRPFAAGPTPCFGCSTAQRRGCRGRCGWRRRGRDGGVSVRWPPEGGCQIRQRPVHVLGWPQHVPPAYISPSRPVVRWTCTDPSP